MKGTEKQIAFAREVLRGAKAWYSKVNVEDQVRAIEVLELVESGDFDKAEDVLQDAAPWVTFCIVEGTDGSPVVDAGKVIDALKKAYYLSVDNMNDKNEWRDLAADLRSVGEKDAASVAEKLPRPKETLRVTHPSHKNMDYTWRGWRLSRVRDEAKYLSLEITMNRIRNVDRNELHQLVLTVHSLAENEWHSNRT
jgi:hypothetical protein